MWFCLPRPAWHGLPLLGQRRLAWPRLLLLLSAVVCWPWLSLAGLGVAVVHLLEQFFGFLSGLPGLLWRLAISPAIPWSTRYQVG